MNISARLRKTLYIIGMTVVATALLVLCLPRESQKKFNYEINRPWTYSLLTAPFDIPIHLDDVAAKELQDSIDATFEPVFVRDLTLEKTNLAEFATRLNSDRESVEGTGLTPAQRNELVERMRQIYDSGIVSAADFERIRKNDISRVRFIYGNEAMAVPTAEFASERMAYASLDSTFREAGFQAALRRAHPDELLQPNLHEDTAMSRQLLEEAYQKALAPIGVVQKGERIIDRGDIVTRSVAKVLDTYEKMLVERGVNAHGDRYYPILGKILFILIALAVLGLYLQIFRPEYLSDYRTVGFLLAMIVGFTFFVRAMYGRTEMGMYMVPLTIVPVMIVIFLDSRTALFTHLIVVLITATMSAYAIEYIFLQFVAGCAAIDSIKDLSRRGQLIRTATLVFLAYISAYVAIELLVNGNLRHLEGRMFGNLGINAVLVSFAYILLFVLERMFGFTSRVTLVELSDINNKLLRKLSEDCPGTFQHSMAVSNLATSAAGRIGANVQLVRAGALYHDIGKTKNPAFFTENQHGLNPHSTLAPEQSARIVIDHVIEGAKMADKAKLPQVITDFILQHHGKGKARYFYNTWCNANPGKDPDDAAFTYPGPNPQTKEASLLMMADAVEAASRSLTDHSAESITSLVSKIIDTQIAEGLHAESPLSFRDVGIIKKAFASRLGTLYHTRISYPDLKTQ